MFESASPFADYVDTTLLLVAGVSLLVLIGLVVVMVLFVVRYSRKRNPHPSNIEGNTALEVLWTVIPLVLFMGMFYLGWEGYLRTDRGPRGGHSHQRHGPDVVVEFRIPQRRYDRHALRAREYSRQSHLAFAGCEPLDVYSGLSHQEGCDSEPGKCPLVPDAEGGFL